MSSQPAQSVIDSATRWRRIEDLFHCAAELPPGERTAFLEEACGSDTSLLPEVLDLLQSDSDVAERVEAQKPVGSREPDQTGDAEFLPFRTSTDSWLGRTLGHYTVERELGRGGMGVVYLGRRDTPGPHPQAAIKVVRRNLQDSPALKHFLLERDALARLEHPNIARLLDGGVTLEGIPWLALEYVEGQRLDEFCESPGVTVETILGLLIQLCAAVGYVHRNLILHRDLKPGNVMVTSDGPSAHNIKLLDFGTLKILENDEASAMTQAGMRPVTLRFASPEHVHGQRVSTASDVYSLGIILYRLLAGRFPEPSPEAADTASSSQPQKPFQSPMAGFFEDLREDRFEPPSAFATLPMAAELARDLDAITMKAIRYNPADRYQTADALAAELSRALDNQPVEARGNNRAYLARKFYLRHEVALWTAAAAFLILFGALLVMARETRAAHAEQARADMGVDQERKLAHLLLFDYFEQLKLIEDSTDAQKRAVSQAVTYLDQLNREAATGDASLQLEEVRAYTRLGSLLGSPYEENLGDAAGAVQVLDKAVALGSQLLAHHPHELPFLLAQAEAYQHLGQAYLGAANVEPAVAALKKGVALEGDIVGNPAVQAKDIAITASVEDSLADAYFGSGQPSLGEPAMAAEHVRRAIELQRKALTLDPTCSRCSRGIGVEFWKLGSFDEDDNPTEAEKGFEDALTQLATLPAADRNGARNRRFVRVIQQHLGSVEVENGHIPEGLALVSRVREEFRAAALADPLDQRNRFDLLVADLNLGHTYFVLDRSALAQAPLQECVESADVLLKTDSANKEWLFSKANCLLTLDEVESYLHNKAAAELARNAGLPIMLELAREPDAPSYTMEVVSKTLERTETDPQLELALARKVVASTHNPDPQQWLNLAFAEKRTGGRAAAHQAARNALQQLLATSGIQNTQLLAEARQLVNY